MKQYFPMRCCIHFSEFVAFSPTLRECLHLKAVKNNISAPPLDILPWYLFQSSEAPMGSVFSNNFQVLESNVNFQDFKTGIKSLSSTSCLTRSVPFPLTCACSGPRTRTAQPLFFFFPGNYLNKGTTAQDFARHWKNLPIHRNLLRSPLNVRNVIM